MLKLHDKVEWASFFPQMKALPTKDARIFQTPFEKIEKNKELLGDTLKKTYFACIVGGNCYGVDVIRKQAVDSRKECMEAFNKVKQAVWYYEDNGEWPKD